MLIYIVQYSSFNYESTYVVNLKAFFDKDNAELYMTDLQVKSLEVKERIKKLWETHGADKKRIYSLNVTNEERAKLLRECGRDFFAVEENIREESGLEYFEIDKNEGFEIEELECGDVLEVLLEKDFSIE